PAGGSTEVCPDDVLRTRFTIANYSTSGVDLEARMYLSADDRFDVQDVVSVTRRPISIAQSDSANFPRSWQVPNAGGSEFYVIVRVTGETRDGVAVVDDWI